MFEDIPWSELFVSFVGSFVFPLVLPVVQDKIKKQKEEKQKSFKKRKRQPKATSKK